MTITDRPVYNSILYNENGNPVSNSSSFIASTNGTTSSGTVGGTTTSLAYLWHPNTVTKRIEIHRIDVSMGGGSSGNFMIRGAFISAENRTPGGTSQTINGADRDDSVSSGMIFRTGANAPTRVAGDLLTWNSGGGGSAQYVWEKPLGGKPIVLRASQSEGFEIRSVIGTALLTAATISVTFYWTEI